AAASDAHPRPWLQPQQGTLAPEAPSWVSGLNELQLLLNGQVQLFFRQSSSAFNCPICWYKAAFSVSSSLDLFPRRLTKIWGKASNATFFHCVICTGCTPYAVAISLAARSPRMASMATFALNAPLCCRRLIVIVSFSLTAPRS